MKIDKLISMTVNRVLRQLLNKGVDAGIEAGTKALSKRKGMGATSDSGDLDRRAKETAKRAKKAVRLTRRIGRF